MFPRILIMIFLFCITNFLFSANNDDKNYFHDVSFDLGVYPYINKVYQPNLTGSVISFQNVNYLSDKIGFRTGISIINDLEGSDRLYSVPIYFAYRTSTQRKFAIGPVSSIQELIIGVILGLIPRNCEFNIGTNIGFIDKDNTKGFLMIDNKAFSNSYIVKNSFWSSIDGGVRLKYNIWRFGLVLSPGLSYSLTRNFIFDSDLPNDENNGLRPAMFFRFTGGISFRF